MLLLKKQSLACLLVLLPACQAERQPLARHGNIIGINEIVPVAVARESGQVQDTILTRSLSATALLVTVVNNRYVHCLGSLLPAAQHGQNPRIITNRHCFANARTPLTAMACTRTSVYFNFSQPHTPLIGRRCLPGSLRAHVAADLAIFTLQRQLPPHHRPFKLWKGSVPAAREAFLLHYPHVIHSFAAPARSVSKLPGTRLYFPITAVSADGCVVKGRPRKGLWRLIPFGMVHSCDMTKGSSGAALIDFQTGQLLGVSWGGLSLRVGKVTKKINFAVSADLLQKFIANQPLHDNLTDNLLKL